MAITTLDGVIAGMQPPEEFAKVGAGTQVVGRYYSPFYVGARPAAAAVPSPGVAGAALTTYGGQIPFGNGAADQYLAGLHCWSATAGTLVICDRLWHNSGLSATITTAQTVNSVAWPARDKTGTTNGDGIRVGLEVSTITGAGASVHSMSVTDQGGTAGRTITPRVAYTAASIVGCFYDYGMTAAVGMTGVRSIQTFTSTVSMTSGVYHLVAYRVLGRVDVPAASTAAIPIDAITGGLPKLHDNTVPFFLWLPGNSTAPTALMGQVLFTNG